MTSTDFDFTAFAAKSDRMNREAVAFARAIAGAQHLSDVRAVVAAMPGHAAMSDLPDSDVYAYAFGVLATIVRDQMADLAERELDRHA